MKKLLFVAVFIVLILLNCASGSKHSTSKDSTPIYQSWSWNSDCIQEETDKVTVTSEALYDNKEVLSVYLKIWNKSDESMEIEDIILKDSTELIIFPLSPWGVAYAHLGRPRVNLPVLPSYSTSKKKFMVADQVDEFPESDYSANLELKKPITGQGRLNAYLQGLALGRSIYIAKFKRIATDVIDNSFKTDMIPAHSRIKACLYYHEESFHCPLYLDVYLKSLGQQFAYKYMIYPPMR